MIQGCSLYTYTPAGGVHNKGNATMFEIALIWSMGSLFAAGAYAFDTWAMGE